MQFELPTPSAEALAHSESLSQHLRQQIAVAGGWLSFADYMDLALYAPGLGYYSAGASKFGASGDFVTAPEISPVFSQCLAGQCAEILENIGGGSILELGAGTGTMLTDVLLEMERLNKLPVEYLVLEPSADLRARQAETLQARAPQFAGRVRWLDGAPDGGLRGVILANEVVDALPVNRFVIESGEICELGVVIEGTQFGWSAREASSGMLAALSYVAPLAGGGVPDGYTSEVCLRLPAWVELLGSWLDEGAALLLDYGFPRREYYLPERSSGTLRCYYRHRAHEDPFLWPGLQDVTAWVDFSLLAEAAEQAGLEVAGYTTQANFLLAAGIDERVAAAAADPRAQIAMAAGLRQLLLPGEMGEAVKVMALTSGGADAPSGMFGRDLRSRL
jgi:SAM-dependent MidA family methyltransferase